MPVTPAGSLTLPAWKVRRMFSLSTTFQDTIAAAHGVPATPAGALPWIFMRRVEPTTPKPYACISIGDQHGYHLVAGGSQNHLRAFGGLFAFLGIPTDPAYLTDPIQAEYAAGNFLGQVMDEVTELSGQDDPGSVDGTSHLAIVRADLIVPTFGENPEEEWEDVGRFYSGMYSLHWGDEERYTQRRS